MSALRDKGPIYAEKGLSVVPVDMSPGERNKRPLVRYGGKRLPLSAAAIAKIAERNPDAGVALNVGYSGLVLIDIDSADQGLARDVLARFGPTSVVARTPSGGFHGWYSDPDGLVTKSANLRPSEGLDVDIKAGVALGIVPPTFNPSKGGSYAPVGLSEAEFVDELLTAPQIDPAGLPFAANDGFSVGEGARNTYALKHWRIMANNAATWETYLAEAHGFNAAHFDPPWAAAEVEKQCRYWWDKKRNGALRVPGMGWNAATFTPAETQPLLPPDMGQALALWLFLRQRQPLEGTFAIAPKALNRAHPALGSRNTIRDALRALVRLDYLRVAHRGGAQEGDPHTYVFGPFPRGSIVDPNRNNTLPPVYSPSSSSRVGTIKKGVKT